VVGEEVTTVRVVDDRERAQLLEPGVEQPGVGLVATYGGAADLTREQIVSLTTGGPDDPCWTEAEATLIRFADALHHEATVDDLLWSTLREHHSEEAVLELLLLAGFYRTTSYLVNALSLPLEPGAASFADYAG